MKKIIFALSLAIIMILMWACANDSVETNKETANTNDPAVTMSPIDDVTAIGSDGLAENDIKADDGTVIVRAACVYPTIEYEDQAIVDKINAALKKKAEDFVLRADSCRVLAEDYYAFYEGDIESFVPYSLIGTYEITLFNDEYVSVLFSFSENTGGFHANESISGVTFSLANGEAITLIDVFGFEETTVKSIVGSHFKDKINDDPSSYYDDAKEAASDYVDVSMFYLTEEGITVYLPMYSIAPFTTGIPKVTVAYSDIPVLD